MPISKIAGSPEATRYAQIKTTKTMFRAAAKRRTQRAHVSELKTDEAILFICKKGKCSDVSRKTDHSPCFVTTFKLLQRNDSGFLIQARRSTFRGIQQEGSHIRLGLYVALRDKHEGTLQLVLLVDDVLFRRRNTVDR